MKGDLIFVNIFNSQRKLISGIVEKKVRVCFTACESVERINRPETRYSPRQHTKPLYLRDFIISVTDMSWGMNFKVEKCGIRDA